MGHALRRGLRASLVRALSLALVLPAAASASEVLYASQIDADNAATYRVQGPDAIGGIGDWAIGNGTLCAVVSDPAHESILSDRGGVLIDLAHCDRANDQFNALQPLMNLSRSGVVPVSEIRAELDPEAQTASIVTRGHRNGVSLVTTYRLSTARPSRLEIVSRLSRSQPGDRVFLIGDIALHGRRQLSGFALAARRLSYSTGFHHSALDPYRPLEMLGAIVPGDTQIMVGGDAFDPSISYGLQVVNARLEAADGSVTPVRTLTVNGADFSMIGVFAHPFWIGGEDELGLVALAQTLLMDIDEGDTLVIERVIHVGERADVASVTDAIFENAPRVSGRVSDPAARLHVALAGGAPVTFVRPAADGSFSFRLPSGSYELRALAPAGRSFERSFEVADTDVALGSLSLGAVTRVQLPRGTPMRLSFVPAEGSRVPRFGDDLLDFRIGDERVPASTETRDVSLAGIASDPASVQLAPGRYEVFATRGVEYELSRANLVLNAGETKKVAIAAPARALRTPRWIAADLHVHSQWSDDSALPQDQRIASFAAQGGEVMVTTEHDHLVDFAPRIRELGLAGRIASVAGAEVTSTSHSEATPSTFGHVNVFPLTPRPLEYRGGVPKSEGLRLRDLIAEVRALDGAALVQLNHPREAHHSSSDGAFFSHLSIGKAFDPALPLSDAGHASLIAKDSQHGVRDIDFDAIELMNGPSLAAYRRIRADWFSLLLQGEIRTATANSDSHSAGEIVNLPLNYVRLAKDSVAGFRERDFIAALQAGRSYGTTGPILELELRGERQRAGIGDTFRGREGTLELTVRAASWIAVDEARVFVDGELVYGGTLEAGETQSLPLRFERDAFLTVEVEGAPGARYQAVAPGFTPFAFSNPIFVDADGDGVWTAPGLPAEPPETIVGVGVEP